ncbi:MAG: YggT family protein [Rhodobacteraceae bacterium]|nr:YggT family protein [Paracoccaceae bacterium]
MQSIFMILSLLLDVAWFIIIAHVIMSWLISFQVLNPYQPFVANIWQGINRLLEPVYRPLRRVLPDLGGLDLTPLVALIGIAILRIVLANNAAYFF